SPHEAMSPGGVPHISSPRVSSQPTAVSYLDRVPSRDSRSPYLSADVERPQETLVSDYEKCTGRSWSAPADHAGQVESRRRKKIRLRGPGAPGHTRQHARLHITGPVPPNGKYACALRWPATTITHPSTPSNRIRREPKLQDRWARSAEVRTQAKQAVQDAQC